MSLNFGIFLYVGVIFVDFFMIFIYLPKEFYLKQLLHKFLFQSDNVSILLQILPQIVLQMMPQILSQTTTTINTKGKVQKKKSFKVNRRFTLAWPPPPP